MRTDQAQPYAIRIRDGRSELRPLTLGARGQAGGVLVVEILQGLVEGDRVLAASAGLVPAGVRLKLPAAVAAQPATPAAPRRTTGDTAPGALPSAAPTAAGIASAAG